MPTVSVRVRDANGNPSPVASASWTVTAATSSIKFGACPSVSAGQDAQDCRAKWGPGMSMRTFDEPDTGMDVAPRPAGVEVAHHSWKAANASGKPAMSVLTDARLVAALANYQDGDCVTEWHETPVKFRAAKLTAAEADTALAVMNDLHERVVRLRTAGDIPDVQTVFIDAAWMWDNTSGLYPGTSTDRGSCAFWMPRVNADYIGIDFDAYQNLSLYPDMAGRCIPNILDSLTRWPRFKGWMISEFMHPRIASDPSGTQRAAWVNAQVAKCQAAAVRPVNMMLFDTNHRDNQIFTTGSPEYQAWKALIDA